MYYLIQFSVSFIHKSNGLQRSKIHILFFILSTFSFSILQGQNLILKIEGKDDFETKTIDSLNYQKSFSTYLSLEQEINRTHLKLQKIGYLENEIRTTYKNNDSTYISHFALNKKYNTIYIYYDKNLVDKDFLESIISDVHESYFILEIKKVEPILNKINSSIIDNGLPFASLKLDGFKKKSQNHIEATLKIDTNKKRTVDNIIIKGYEKFPKSFLKHYLKIKTKKNLNLSSLKDKTNALNNLPFAKQIRSPELLFTKDSSTVYLYLEKSKSNTFDGFLGFGTNEDTNKIEFDGYLNLSLTNNLNYGESFNLNYKSDENEQKTFLVNLNLPYLFNSPIGTELSLNIFKKDSTFTTVDQSASLFYQINQKQRVFLEIASTQSNSLLKNTIQQQNTQDYNSTFYKIKYHFTQNQLNNPLFPINFNFVTSIGLGKRINKSNEERQSTLLLDTYKIFNLNKKNSIYIKLKSQAFDSKNYFENELLRFGGINSIRGFEENSLLASLYGVINTEYRLNLSPSIYVHSIIDAAYLENKNLQLKEKLFGFGFGFGILTKAGLLKFNYANGKYENQKTKLSNSKIHISLNAKF